MGKPRGVEAMVRPFVAARRRDVTFEKYVFGADTKARVDRSGIRCNEIPLADDGRTRTVHTDEAEWHWTVLMEQSLDGDCTAYHRLLSLLTPALRRAIRSRAESAGLEAEDVVQEVLLALHLKRNTWIRGTPIAPWVAAIARNKLVDAYRRRGRRPEIPIDSVVDTLLSGGDDHDDRSLDLERAFAGLPARQREVLQAVSLEGHSAREAAARLEMSEVAVRVTLHRGLKTLAALFRKKRRED
jgi:RNA polymerase sigma-70 factor (ECF subfamily)